MTLKLKTLLAVALCGFMAPSTVLAEEHDHDHDEHAVKGPNNGRMIMEVENFSSQKIARFRSPLSMTTGKWSPLENKKSPLSVVTDLSQQS